MTFSPYKPPNASGSRPTASGRNRHASERDTIPHVLVAWKPDGHIAITIEASKKFESRLSRREPRYFNLGRLDFSVDFRDTRDIPVGHMSDTGQRHHFMRYEGQTDWGAYTDGKSWIIEKGLAAANGLKPRIDCFDLYRERNNYREFASCFKSGDVEEPLGDALHALQDSFSPSHTDREKGSLIITRVHTFSLGDKEHGKLDKSWSKDGRFSDLADAAVNASVALMRAVVTAASSQNLSDTWLSSAEKDVFEPYLKTSLKRTGDFVPSMSKKRGP
jgi:hypothetical protein